MTEFETDRPLLEGPPPVLTVRRSTADRIPALPDDAMYLIVVAGPTEDGDDEWSIHMESYPLSAVDTVAFLQVAPKAIAFGADPDLLEWQVFPMSRFTA